MSSIWNRNISLFSKRFPALCELLTAHEASYADPFAIMQAKNGAPTAVQDGLPLHSKYNPQNEAAQLVQKFPAAKTAAVFLSFGLGYAPVAFAQALPDIPIIIIEPDFDFAIAALHALDWSAVLSHKELIFAIGAAPKEAVSLMERYGMQDMQVYESANQTAHAKDYYAELHALMERTTQKERINTNTLEKFARLWLRNSCRNLTRMTTCHGVQKYMGRGSDIPFVILAAGPSLQGILPHLAELKKRSILVCVDTALHSCIQAGVEPDFIVLVDPQHACARHLDFLASPSSVLITESAAWPSVFRFKCKEIVLCSSLFPLGKYFELRLGEKGRLGAGGSVTTTAWDFAYSTGTREIYIAGMDLGFPGRQTHIRGSQFEERAHRLSTRTGTAETDGVASLISANPQTAKDYRGEPLLTDERMTLFSWWFEENCAKAKANGCMTYTLTPQSLAISGIVPVTAGTLLSRQPAEQERERFLAGAQKPAEQSAEYGQKFRAVLEEFKGHLERLAELSRDGIRLCDSAIKDRSTAPKTFAKLDAIDREILQSSAKDAAALVFPTQRQLEKKSQGLPEEPVLHQLYYSRLIYTELSQSISQYKKYL